MDNTEQTRESKNKIGKTDQNKTNHNTLRTQQITQNHVPSFKHDMFPPSNTTCFILQTRDAPSFKHDMLPPSNTICSLRFRRLMYPMFPVFVFLCTLCFRFSSSYFLCSPVSLDCPFLIAPLVFSNVYVFTPQIREAEVNLIPFNTHVHHRSLFCLEKGI
jgi:hypothetical protein